MYFLKLLQILMLLTCADHISGYETAVACWTSGRYNLDMDCGSQMISVTLQPDVSFYGVVDDTSTCSHVDNGCQGPIPTHATHTQILLNQCQGKSSCSQRMVQFLISCVEDLEYNNYEQVSYECVDQAMSVPIVLTTTEAETTRHTREHTAAETQHHTTRKHTESWMISTAEDFVTTARARRTTRSDERTTQSLVIPTRDMVTDVIEPMTTQIPQITQGLIDGCQDLNGEWSSKHTSERLTLNHNEDDSVDGLYNSCANCGWLGVEGRKATRESTLGLLVIGQGGDVVISWAGQCYVCGDEEVIHLHRLNYDIDQGSGVACDNDSSDVYPEESVFYRA